MILFRLALCASLLSTHLHAADPFTPTQQAIDELIKMHTKAHGIPLDESIQKILYMPSMLQQISTVSYDSDESFQLSIGDLSANITWGFAGSGDCLIPLPPMSVSITAGTPDAKNPSMQGLATLLIQKKLLAEHVLRFLEPISKDPLYLFGLKAILLFKDYRGDTNFIREELARLLLRFSLSTSSFPEYLKSIKSLSGAMPASLRAILIAYAPETAPAALEMIDGYWTAMMQPEACTALTNSLLPLSEKDTVIALAATMINGARRLVTDRQAYFAKHPGMVKAQQEKNRFARRQEQLIKQYLATREGKHETQKIEQALTRIRNRYTIVDVPNRAIAFDIAEKDINALQKLRAQAKEFAQLGQVSPANLQAAIIDLEAKISDATKHGATHPLTARSSITNELATIYSNAADRLREALRQDIQTLKQSLNKPGSDAYLLIIEENAAILAQQPALAYAESLTTQAKQLHDRAHKMTELARLRYLYKLGVLDASQEAEFAQFGLLEAEVSYLLNPSSMSTFFDEVLSKPSSIQAIKHEVCYNDTTYKSLRTDITDQLVMIMKRSTHLQEYMDMYRYMLALMIPELVPVVDRLIAIQQAVV